MGVVNILGGNIVAKKNSRPTSIRSYHHGDLRRALIEAALELLTEEQNWTFSLREVARRASVSHNAPYNHFADKRDLLAEIAASGFRTLRDRMKASIANVDRADVALVSTGVVYVRFGLENPAFYRLMFGSVLGASEEDRPEAYVSAANEAKAVLVAVIERGAKTGVFPGLQGDPKQVQIAALCAWSTVHGFTMLVIDGLANGLPRRAINAIAKQVTQTLADGLKAITHSKS
jgi:AcrR family transcriptional regulator